MSTTGRFMLAIFLRVDRPLGAVVPGDVVGSDRMPHEQVLHLAAAVDEHRVGMVVKEGVRFEGHQVFHEVCAT